MKAAYLPATVFLALSVTLVGVSLSPRAYADSENGHHHPSRHSDKSKPGEKDRKDKGSAGSERSKHRTDRVENPAIAQPDTSSKDEKKEARLDANRLKKCQDRSATIDESIQKASGQGTEQLKVFDSIAQRTQKFYEEHDYYSAEYHQVVADLNQKRERAGIQLTEMTSGGQTFNCEGSDPDSALATFRAEHHQKNDALKQYKAAIRELIVTVKAADPAKTKERD